MAMHTNPLNHVRIAAPCSADWERMTGTKQVRFCDQCNLNVYNLSGMMRRDAENLIARNEGRLCVRYYHRADGSILTDNCPVGLRALKRRASRMARATLSTVLSFFAGLGAYAGWSKSSSSGSAVMGAIGIAEPVNTSEQVERIEMGKQQGRFEMGDMAAPAPDNVWVTGTFVEPAHNGEQQSTRKRGKRKTNRAANNR